MTRLQGAAASLFLSIENILALQRTATQGISPHATDTTLDFLITSTCAGINKPNESNQHGSTASDQKTVRLASGEMIDRQQNDSNEDNHNTGQTYECAFHNDCEIMFFTITFAIRIAQS